MKKLATLLLAAGLVLAASAPASAGDVKLGLYNGTVAAFGDNGFDQPMGFKPFNVYERIRMNFQYVASESLSGFIQLQAGTGTWGEGPKFLSMNNRFFVRQAYLDWLIPGTRAQVRMGLQALALPSAVFGNPVLDDVFAAAVVTVPVNDMFACTIGYVRPGNNTFLGATLDGTAYWGHQGWDAVFGVAALNANGFSFKPWAMYTKYHHDYALGVSNGYGWWLGASAEYTGLTPLTVSADVMYGKGKIKDLGGAPFVADKGWLFAAGLKYALPFGTPFLKGWYATGDKSDSNHKMPLLSGAWDANFLYFDGALTYHDLNGLTDPTGTWGVSAGIEGVSFMPGLEHMARFVYTQGTNHDNFLFPIGDLGYMTNHDKSYEFDLTSTYKIYENLTFGLELGYAINKFEDKNIKNSWEVVTSFVYNF